MQTDADTAMVIVGMDCRIPDADGLGEFEAMLFHGRSGIAEVPEDRFDRSLYFDPKKGVTGKSYTTLGGCIPERSPDRSICPLSPTLEALSDPTHVQFCEVAARAWKHAGLTPADARWDRTGVYVGHSGGTKFGGPLSLATQIEDAVSFLRGIDGFRVLPENTQQAITEELVRHVRRSRPQRTPQKILRFNAYQAAALTAQSLGLTGPRSVIDAACASSLLALCHATMAIRAGRIDAAIVGGATYNSVDNLILFSHSQACSDNGSRPFDDHANGLVSSEGYVAIVVTTAARAQQMDLPIRAIIRGMGVASDGRGRSLWAPRKEGQQLALRRAYQNTPILDIDYLEAHATSTQLGDATELATLRGLTEEAGAFRSPLPLLLGSVKSNIGHTLEAAGLIGLVKVLLSMQRNELAPSLNFQEPNSRFDWKTSPVAVVDKRQSWPQRGPTRRAGVSAFGIGGLNAHIHVAEPGPIDHGILTGTAQISDEQIAIVGRGLVLPGALNVSQFGQLLQSRRSAVAAPPPERWPGNIGVAPAAAPQSHRAPTNRGGYITDFEFDGQKYRIPPKQVRQANPAQMMLIDAVAQAADECDQGEWSFDRQRTAVVIGTIFGGEFGDQLQVGMRLPEICRELVAQLRRFGVETHTAESIAREYRTMVLKQRPALLDETGSFTASTLASRIAKTFDLMGGACALDGDDASGLSALSIAVDQLRSGVSDLIICGSAQRTMNLSAFEELDLKGQLVRSGRVEDIPDDCSRVLPGEGVVALMLCRLSDAVKSGRTIYGLVDDVQTAQSDRNNLRTAADAELVRRIGYLSGCHGLVRIVAESLKWQANSADHSAISVSSTAHDGYTVQATIRDRAEPGDASSVARASSTASSPAEPLTMQTIGDNRVAVQRPEKSMSLSNSEPPRQHALRVVRIDAKSPEQMLRALDAGLRNVQRLWSDPSRSFSAGHVCRIAVLAESIDELTAGLTAARKAWTEGRRGGVLERHRTILWEATDDQPRIAWLFPGQGSQYSGCPSALEHHEAATSNLREVDRILSQMRLSALSESLHDDGQRLGRDVWWTQLWALGSSTSLAAALRNEGMSPDVVLGHSFGEFSASVASGVLTLRQALHVSRHRSDAVVTHTRERGGLLSVRGSLTEVDAALRSSGLQVYITHHNGPRQTVIAGTVDAVEAARKVLVEADLASVVIPVPAAFHTPLLADAESAFRRLINSESLRPPTCGFLSATSGQYMAEPDAVRDSLITQLTRPVLYVPSVRRLLDDGCRLLLEVGPNDVLTRMNREIVDDEALCLSLDVPGQSHDVRMLLVKTALECVSGTSPVAAGSTRLSVAKAAPTALVFDVTDHRQPDMATEASPASDASTPEPIEAPAAAVTRPAPSGNEQVRSFLLDLVVELTGYSPDVLDFDADLEADLGLDSIKKAQILGELGEWAGLTVRPDSLRLDDIRTLADAAGFAENAMHEAGTSPDPAPTPAGHTSEPVSPVVTASVADPVLVADPVAVSDDSDLARQLETLLIDFVVDQTGYSRDIVDLDADLESDLGLDSIKQAQLIGELKEQFDLQNLSLERVARADFRTLRTIRQFLMTEIDDAGAPAELSRPVETKAAPIADPVPSSITAAADSSGIIGVDPMDEIPDDWARWFQPTEQTANVQAAWQAGYELGQQRKVEIRAALRTLVDRGVTAISHPVWGPIAQEEFRGLAAGAGVAEESIQFAAGILTGSESRTGTSGGNGHARRNGNGKLTAEPTASDQDEAADAVDLPAAEPVDEAGTHRFLLRVVPAPQREGMPAEPELHGAALILGSGPLAEALAARVRELGQPAHVLADLDRIDDVESRLQAIFSSGLTPHLFLATAHDSGTAHELDPKTWQARRERSLEIPFRLCQLWMQSLIDADLMDSASVVAVTRLGGDFGFSGKQVESIEGVGGLVKAMLIECWMRGFRSTPMKVIDICPQCSPDQAVAGILGELAVPSYDMEIAIRNGQRYSVQAFPGALDTSGETNRKGREITKGGHWILSGGGRGITAMTGMELAERHDLTLHLLGTAPVPDVSEQIRQAAAVDRSALRRQIMREASARGENPVEYWRNTEKAIEIDITLQECRRRNIRAAYYSCDVSDVDSLSRTLEGIRQQHGAITGIIHGAGAGQDSRFDRKRPDKVAKCLKAKIDGALALMHTTANDPLEWFAAFGSISGRFGANGHTDYSLANDAMAKIIDRYRMVRPNVSSVTFHWHAWGDVGMATKPEARLALEMIDMEFMPAADGVRHFLNELEHGGDEPEVLITDLSYFRKFFPAERIAGESQTSAERRLPLLHGRSACSGDFLQDDSDGAQKLGSHVVTLDPVRDRFLSQHRIQDRPTLPFVVALELMAEAARCLSGKPVAIECLEAQAFQAIRFPTDDSLAITVDASQSDDARVDCSLLADVRRRDGRLVEENRKYFAARFELADAQDVQRFELPNVRSLEWESIPYSEPGAPIYHGPELQELQRISVAGSRAWGRISASAPVQLFGAGRTRGFTVPCSTMDGCLYAVAVFAWKQHQKASLPVSFGRIRFGRIPDPGEPCLVRIDAQGPAERGAAFDFLLLGLNGDVLLEVTDYRLAWMGG